MLELVVIVSISLALNVFLWLRMPPRKHAMPVPVYDSPWIFLVTAESFEEAALKLHHAYPDEVIERVEGVADGRWEVHTKSENGPERIVNEAIQEGGFKNMGEFCQAVMDAERTGHVDERLRPLENE